MCQGASSDYRFANTVSGIFTNGALDITVGGVTELIGATLNSGQGLLNLDTGALITRDLTDVDRSSSFSAGVTLQDPLAGQRQPNGAPPVGTPSPGALDYVSGVSGSYARSILEGQTLATIGQGSVTVRNQTDEQTSLQLAGLNRDAATNQIITRDDSFRTGNLEFDAAAFRRAGENARSIQAELGARASNARFQDRSIDARSPSDEMRQAGLSDETIALFEGDPNAVLFGHMALELSDEFTPEQIDALFQNPEFRNSIRTMHEAGTGLRGQSFSPASEGATPVRDTVPSPGSVGGSGTSDDGDDDQVQPTVTVTGTFVQAPSVQLGVAANGVRNIVENDATLAAGIAYQGFTIAMSANPARAGIRAAAMLAGGAAIDRLFVEPAALAVSAGGLSVTESGYETSRDRLQGNGNPALADLQSGYGFIIGTIVGTFQPNRPSPRPARPTPAPEPTKKATDDPKKPFDPNRCNCFAAGTEVLTPDGLVEIQSLDIGDIVIARHEVTGELGPQPVTALIRPPSRRIWNLDVVDASGDIERFRTTDDHPWHNAGTGVFEPTKDLTPGERLSTLDGTSVRVVSVAITATDEPAYNLTVANAHTFFVGEDGIWVHNQDCFPDLPEGSKSTGYNLPGAGRREVFEAPNGQRLYKGEDGKYYDLDVHAPTNKNLSGTRTDVNKGEDGKPDRGLQRENDLADALASARYKVEQNPGTRPDTGANPDYKINGEWADGYAPGNSATHTIGSEVASKAASQGNVVVNVSNSGRTISGMQNELKAWYKENPTKVRPDKVFFVDAKGRVEEVKTKGW